MKFFILKKDEAFHNAPNIKQWFGQLDIRHINLKDAYKIPKRQLFFIRESENTVYTDIIDFPFFMISKTVKNVFDMYEPRILYKQIVLLDKENETMGVYYIPILEQIDCLSDKSELTLGKSEIKKGIIRYQETEGHAVFRIGGVKKQYIAARLDLVESILKRDVTGIGLIELEIEGGEAYEWN